MLKIGEKIREFKILSKIGEGGMGSVYLCEDTLLNKKVALKALNQNLLSEPQFIERFKNEAKVQAMLNHPNIVTLYSFIQEASNYFMIMEYVNGKTLKQILSEQGPFSEQQARKYILQILDAIGFAHSMGIIHRDLKPSNILVDVNDNIKIMDFGIAKVLGDRNLTKTGTKMGTIFYMSPEQIRADKNINQRTDIYSLGIVFYEMLFGTVPFNTNTESDFEIMKEIVEGKGIDENAMRGKISELMIKILKKMTAKNSENRFATCYQISEALTSNNLPDVIENIGINIETVETAEDTFDNEISNIEIKKNVFPRADFGKRILAYMIDNIVFGLPLIIILSLVFLHEKANKNFDEYVILFLILLVFLFIRDGINKGKGVGKGIVGLRVIDLKNGKVISKGKGFNRRFFELIIYYIITAIIPAGGFVLFIIEVIMCNSGNGQRLVDKFFQVQVVNETDIIVDNNTLEVKPSETALQKLYS